MVDRNGVEKPFQNGTQNKENENKSHGNSTSGKPNGKLSLKLLEPQSTLKSVTSGDNEMLRVVRVDPYCITNGPYEYNLTVLHPESPARIVDPSDLFVNPHIYKKYSICADIEDTITERLAKQIEKIKNVTRDKAVTSVYLTAGENAVYWLVNTFKFLTSGWFGLVILLVTIMSYGALGALMFIAIEGPTEEKYNTKVIDIRKELVDKMEKIVRNKTIMMTDPDFLTLLKDDFLVYERNYVKYYKYVQTSTITENTWTFWNSFVFAGTIYTTTGYGHMYPKTTAGQVATMMYAIIGIPLFLIALTSFGKFLTRLIKFFWMHVLIFCCKRAPRQEAEEVKSEEKYRPASIEGDYELMSSNFRSSEVKPETTCSLEIVKLNVDEEFNLPISVALSVLILYMMGGAYMAHIIESWSYFEAFYCIFISMSTIGFGDYVLKVYMVYSVVYLIFGLSLTAMCIGVVQKNMTVMFKNAREKFMMMIDETKNTSPDDGNIVPL